MKRVLHKMGQHGAGDNVQFSSVIRHLKRYKPDWQNYVWTHAGKHSSFDLGVTEIPAEPFDEVFDHRWRESSTSYKNAPGTKTVRCLKDIFGLPPDWDLLRYEIPPDPTAERVADEIVRRLPAGRFVVLHYLGESSQDKKNLTHEEARAVCDWLHKVGIVPVLLDWEHRSPIPDNVTIYRAKIPKDVASVAAFMRRAALTVTIDSGPGKTAYATDTPNISVWTGMHPYHYCDRAPNAFHLVPEGHEKLIRGNRSEALRFFQSRYPHAVYDRSALAQHVIVEAARILNIEIAHMNNLLTATSFDGKYYLQHKLAGLDYLNYGDWQRNYGKWFVEALELKGKVVLDVGCACGALACGFAEAGALVSGIDPNEHMVKLGRDRWLSTTLKVGSAVELHYWTDATFDFLHSAQVFEHFRPELVPFILRELKRVTKPRGLMFAAFDTLELYSYQGRHLEDEDATHTAIFPMSWWYEQLAAAGWTVDEAALQTLKDHDKSYFKRYDWPAVCCRNVPG